VKSDPVKNNLSIMKNVTGNFLAKLIASMPIEAIRRTAEMETRRHKKPSAKSYSREEALNRIFMVRYRIQHL
jgi:hypothetical protein